MNFNSWQFLIFLPVVLILYYLVPHKFRWVLLLAASYYFYMSWNPTLIFLILGTTLVSYLAGLLMEKTEKKALRRFLLIFTLVICLGVLIFFKYFDFLMQNVTAFLRLFTPDLNWTALNLILPIGISFYTFQTLSYVIDVYKGKFKAEKHFGYYALFVSFFPQLVAGPIERPGDLIPQLRAEHKLNADDLFCGLRIMLVGFFYKCVVADFLGVYVNNVFSNVGEANALSVFLGGFLFTTQMYCDFAGYSEIATGAARMMGIRLSRNFDRPYMSTSYSDFFRRWHITLTRWFTEYVYIPLGGNRKGIARRILNTFIVFLLCGLWHGANWTYVLWGLYAAFFLNLETLLKKPFAALRKKWGEPKNPALLRAGKIIGMYFILIPAAIIFRAENVGHAGQLLGKLFTGFGFGASYFESAMQNLGVNAPILIQLVLCIVCEVILWHFAEIGRDQPEPPLSPDGQGNSLVARRAIVSVYIILAVALCWIALASSGDVSAFQYFQF